MYDGKQVLRFINNYKIKDLYLISNEMNKRIGTGNYDSERTIFNVHYKDINKSNLYQEVKSILEDRNIEYSHKAKTNILNGVTFTSGPDFFMTLGLPFKESDRIYQSGDKKGQNILVPDIKSKDDIPSEVTKYFDYCMKFLENLVGKENIVMAQVHYDEDTPHLQAYFLAIVNEVKRKCYKRNSEGNLIKENGKTILLRDKDNKIIYESIKGIFLNNDQFWKDLGGRNSYANIQDKFNNYITSCGFKLVRGNIGSNKVHQTKLESFNIRHFEMWRQFMNSKPISTRYKNGVYKYLKALMNFGTKWYAINFVKVYNKMTNFTNPNERKKEMAFYTLEELQRFLTVETDLKFRCAFQTLFYCGFRNGELRGLTWNTLTVNKNIVKVPDPKTSKLYTVTSHKTSSSYRTIPIPNFLLKDLSELYNDEANYYGFRDSWYVFGNINPLAATTLLGRKTKNAFMARVKDIRIHDFRHSCASLLIDSGANITLVAKYLGHSKIDETLNTYSHMYQN